MPSIEARLKDLLDETRLAMLGTQLLMGLQYRAAFSPGFDRLPSTFRWLDGVALLFILTAAAILLGTPAFHQIAEAGHATGRMLARASGNLKVALLPLALALGMNAAIGLVSSTGPGWASAAGAGFVVAALSAWYALPLLSSVRLRRPEERMEDKKQSLETRIVQALTELRVVLPGAQALFGFQFIAVLTDSFERLPPASRIVHLISLGLVALAIIMLIAPASYHRIAAGGNAEEGVLHCAVAMMLPAEGLIALGLVGDAYVTVRLISGSHALALWLGIGAALGFTVLLYVFPLISRHGRT